MHCEESAGNFRGVAAVGVSVAAVVLLALTYWSWMEYMSKA